MGMDLPEEDPNGLEARWMKGDTISERLIRNALRNERVWFNTEDKRENLCCNGYFMPLGIVIRASRKAYHFATIDSSNEENPRIIGVCKNLKEAKSAVETHCKCV